MARREAASGSIVDGDVAVPLDRRLRLVLRASASIDQPLGRVRDRYVLDEAVPFTEMDERACRTAINSLSNGMGTGFNRALHFVNEVISTARRPMRPGIRELSRSPGFSFRWLRRFDRRRCADRYRRPIRPHRPRIFRYRLKTSQSFGSVPSGPHKAFNRLDLDRGSCQPFNLGHLFRSIFRLLPELPQKHHRVSRCTMV